MRQADWIRESTTYLPSWIKTECCIRNSAAGPIDTLPNSLTQRFPERPFSHLICVARGLRKLIIVELLYNYIVELFLTFGRIGGFFDFAILKWIHFSTWNTSTILYFLNSEVSFFRTWPNWCFGIGKTIYFPQQQDTRYVTCSRVYDWDDERYWIYLKHYNLKLITFLLW